MSFEQVEAIVTVLERHAVDYVLIGGIAVELHGVPIERSRDLDITPSRSTRNLVRLAAALRELDARIRTNDPDGVAFVPEAELLANVRMLNLVTAHGPFDLAFFPAGTDGYEDLARRAVTIRVGNTAPAVSHLDDLVRSKAAAGRRKDQPVLEIIEQYRRQNAD
jgi:hypothetical protein